MNRLMIAGVGAVVCLLTAGCEATPPTQSAASAASGADLGKCPPDALIDDAEDDNNQVAANKGRNGYWFTFVDKAGSSITPAPGGTYAMSAGGAQGTVHAAHMSGKIGTANVVYAGMGFNFIEPKTQYDASGYKGVTFWAKVGPGSTSKVRLKVPDVDTDPDGKVCTDCFNDFGADLELTEKWTKFTFPFASMTQQQGWGAPHPAGIVPSKVYSMQWQVNAPGASYDVWIDDIAFTGCP